MGAGGHDDNLVFRQALDGGNVHDGALLYLQIAQLLGDFEHILHAPTGDGHLPAMPLGSGDDGLNPVHVGGEGGDDDPLVAVAELPLEALGHQILAGGVAAALNVGGVAEHGKDTLGAQFPQTGKIHHAVFRGGVDFEVAGHNHGANGGVNGEGHRIGDGMVHMDELHLEHTGLDHIPGLVGDEFDLVGQLVFFQLQLDQAVGHGSAMNGAVDLPHGIGNGTNVIFVTVGDEHAPQLLLVGNQIGKIRDHQVNAVHVLFREAHAAVHHDHVLAVLQYGAVLADLIQTAKRNNFQFFSQ